MSTQDGAYTSKTAAGKSDAKSSLSRNERRRRERERARERTGEALNAIVTLGVRDYVGEVGYGGAVLAMEDEATALCGPKGRHDPKRDATRYGHTTTSVRVMGRRVSLPRPRVRWADGRGEAHLTVLEALTHDPGDMDRVVLGAALKGVSQRGYGSVLDTVLGEKAGAGRSVFGQSRSTVNRYFVAATTRIVEELAKRPLTGGSYRTIFLDGIGYAEHLVVAAVGVRDDGTKEVLGLREGSTENHGVCTALFEELIRRGLDPDVKRLFVIDGGKGLHLAVTLTFGQAAKVQRCQAHKIRNVLGQLPEDKRREVKRQLALAWRGGDAVKGEQRLWTLANRLEQEGYEKAAGSLREGLEETLTVSRLGLGRRLGGLLSTTNVIESSFSTVGRAARRVTNWQSGIQVQRWVATGLMLAEQSYRTHYTQDDMKILAAALDTSEIEVDAIGKIA